MINYKKSVIPVLVNRADNFYHYLSDVCPTAPIILLQVLTYLLFSFQARSDPRALAVSEC